MIVCFVIAFTDRAESAIGVFATSASKGRD